MKNKQVIVMRKDLNMRRGKEIAQGSHASMAVFLNRARPTDKNKPQLIVDLWSEAEDWLNEKFAKICVQVNSEEELLEIYNKALEAKIPSALIKDSGLTEFKGIATFTCACIGPYKSEEIDKITAHLKLY